MNEIILLLSSMEIHIHCYWLICLHLNPSHSWLVDPNKYLTWTAWNAGTYLKLLCRLKCAKKLLETFLMYKSLFDWVQTNLFFRGCNSEQHALFPLRKLAKIVKKCRFLLSRQNSFARVFCVKRYKYGYENKVISGRSFYKVTYLSVNT